MTDCNLVCMYKVAGRAPHIIQEKSLEIIIMSTYTKSLNFEPWLGTQCSVLINLTPLFLNHFLNQSYAGHCSL